jgi:hypothetical protein
LRLVICNSKGNCAVKHLAQSLGLATILIHDALDFKVARKTRRIEIVRAVKLSKPTCKRDPTVTLTVETPTRFQLRNEFDKFLLVKTLDLVLQEFEARLIVILILVDVMHRSRHLS